MRVTFLPRDMFCGRKFNTYYEVFISIGFFVAAFRNKASLIVLKTGLNDGTISYPAWERVNIGFKNYKCGRD